MSADVALLRERAAEASETIFTDRPTAKAIAVDVIAANTTDDPAVASEAHRVLARCATAEGASDEAVRHADRSVAAAEMSGDDQLLGQALLTRVGVAASAGRHHDAITDADRAEPLLEPPFRARLAIQRGSVLSLGLNRIDEAIDVLDRAVADHPEMGPLEEAVLRMNRGSLLRRRGDLSRADDDLRVSHELYSGLGHREAASEALLHRALVAARRGDHPTVFEIHKTVLHDDALVRSDPHLALDVSECLMIAGLHQEAERYAAFAVERTAGQTTEHALETGVHAARVQLLAGHRRAAFDAARDVADRAASIGNTTLGGLAELLCLSAGGMNDADDVARAGEIALLLDRAGLRGDALDAMIDAGERAVELGRSDLALGIVPADIDRQAALADELALGRARVRHARAIRSVAAGRPGVARRQIADALRDVERTRVATEATDLRAAASDRAPRLAALGLHLAVQAGDPRPTLEWAERARAAGLRLAGREVGVDDVRDQLDDLRRLDGADRSQVDRLEREITTQVRSVRRDGAVVRSSSADDIVARVGDRTLLEFIEDGDRMLVCVVARGRATLVDLDVSRDEIESTVAKLLFGLRRMSTTEGPAVAASTRMVTELAGRLDASLLSNVGRLDAGVVVVPTGPLHHLPWAVLPTLRRRPFVVAPSAHIWCGAVSNERPGNGTVVATGPGLPEAEREARAIASTWGSRSGLTIDATSAATRSGLPGSAVAHVVCHGRFRVDSPQFSALELADGPFTVYDLEGVPDLPPLMVLSACSLGSVDVRLGDDLLGFPAALFARGVSTLIAALFPVEDRATRALMVSLHEHLAEGVAPAEALCRARLAVDDDSAAHLAAATGFVCFGAG